MRKTLATISPKPGETFTPVTKPAADILIVDNDDMLAADAGDLGLPGLALRTVATVAELELAMRRGGVDAVVISLDLNGGFAAVEQLALREDRTPVIAIAGRGAEGATLEHRLTLAELRGAATSLPKPIDASELALAAVDVIARRRGGDPALAELRLKLEKLALY